MKLKYPKTIRVSSTVFEITYDKKRYDAEFAYKGKPPPGKKAAFIIIGTASNNALRILENIMHELREIVHEEQGTRYVCRGEMKFILSHQEHSDFTARMVGLLDHFIK